MTKQSLLFAFLMVVTVTACSVSPAGLRNSSSPGQAESVASVSSAISVQSSSSAVSSAAMGIPTRITPATPAILCDQSVRLKVRSPGRERAAAVSSQGIAYGTLKDFVRLGVDVSLSIDDILSNIAVPEIFTYLLSNQGHRTVIDSNTGSWVFYDTQSGGAQAFLYYGGYASDTNFYIDWQTAGSGYSGKAVYFLPFSDTNEPFSQAAFFYNSAVPSPFLEMFLQAKPGNASDYSDFHVRLSGNTINQSVTAAARVGFTGAQYAGTYRFITGWDMVGYAKESSGGGVKAWATGTYLQTNTGTNVSSGFFSTNAAGYTNLNGGSNIDFTVSSVLFTNYRAEASNYNYTEYFGTNGAIGYSLATTEARIQLHQYQSSTNTATNFNAPFSIVTSNYISTAGIVPDTNYVETRGAATNYQTPGNPFFFVETGQFSADFQYTNFMDAQMSQTNGAEPVDVKAILGTIPRMTNEAYPALSLPGIVP